MRIDVGVMDHGTLEPLLAGMVQSLPTPYLKGQPDELGTTESWPFLGYFLAASQATPSPPLITYVVPPNHAVSQLYSKQPPTRFFPDI
jgi:hypothetical protein